MTILHRTKRKKYLIFRIYILPVYAQILYSSYKYVFEHYFYVVVYMSMKIHSILTNVDMQKVVDFFTVYDVKNVDMQKWLFLNSAMPDITVAKFPSFGLAERLATLTVDLQTFCLKCG